MVAEKVFAVIAESTRRDILEALAQESKAVGQLVDELGVSQPTVSKHLRVLREAGVVTMRAQGQKRFYGINAEPLALVATWLEALGAGVTAAAVPGAVEAEVLAAAPEAVLAAVEAEAAEVETAEQTPSHSSFTSIPELVDQHLDGEVASSGSTQLDAVAVVLPEAVTAVSPREVVATVVPRQSIIVAADSSVQGQISRSVGRAANRAVDLLAILPTLPKRRRKKDS